MCAPGFVCCSFGQGFCVLSRKMIGANPSLQVGNHDPDGLFIHGWNRAFSGCSAEV